jgi:hypothetical protein
MLAVFRKIESYDQMKIVKSSTKTMMNRTSLTNVSTGTQRLYHRSSAPRYVTKASREETGYDRLSVFQTSHYMRVSIHDIEDLKTASTGMNMDDKINYFESNGVNYTNVIKYYDYVMDLNKRIQTKEETNPAPIPIFKKIWTSVMFAVSCVFS